MTKGRPGKKQDNAAPARHSRAAGELTVTVDQPFVMQLVQTINRFEAEAERARLRVLAMDAAQDRNKKTTRPS